MAGRASRLEKTQSLPAVSGVPSRCKGWRVRPVQWASRSTGRRPFRGSRRWKWSWRRFRSRNHSGGGGHPGGQTGSGKSGCGPQLCTLVHPGTGSADRRPSPRRGIAAEAGQVEPRLQRAVRIAVHAGDAKREGVERSGVQQTIGTRHERVVRVARGQPAEECPVRIVVADRRVAATAGRRAGCCGSDPRPPVGDGRRRRCRIGVEGTAGSQMPLPFGSSSMVSRWPSQSLSSRVAPRSRSAESIGHHHRGLRRIQNTVVVQEILEYASNLPSWSRSSTESARRWFPEAAAANRHDRLQPRTRTRTPPVAGRSLHRRGRGYRIAVLVRDAVASGSNDGTVIQRNCCGCGPRLRDRDGRRHRCRNLDRKRRAGRRCRCCSSPVERVQMPVAILVLAVDASQPPPPPTLHFRVRRPSPSRSSPGSRIPL